MLGELEIRFRTGVAKFAQWKTKGLIGLRKNLLRHHELNA
jgi:hypothetical protein